MRLGRVNEDLDARRLRGPTGQRENREPNNLQGYGGTGGGEGSSKASAHPDADADAHG